MGQYYKPLTCVDWKCTVYDRSTKKTKNSKPEYMLAKLMEHSYIYNETMMSFSNKIYHNPMRVVWVGDYANDMSEDEINNPNMSIELVKELHSIAWGDNTKAKPMLLVEFEPKGKLLVNWSKKLYVDMDKYINNPNADGNINPLSLLTALGNGAGGGDYYGINTKDIGFWAFDRISFEDRYKVQSLNNDGFTEEIYEFKE